MGEDRPPTPDATSSPPPGRPLSPRLVRWVVYALLVLLALAAIRLIDRRAMVRQHEMEQQATQPAMP
jgi:hypothetical protein